MRFVPKRNVSGGSYTTYKVDGLKDIIAKIERSGSTTRMVFGKAVQEAGFEAAKNIHNDTIGKFSARIVKGFGIRNDRQVLYLVGYNKKRWYLKFRETGSKPHIIKGKRTLKNRRGMLAIVVSRQGSKWRKIYYVRRVKHPGQKKEPFLLKEIQGRKADKKMDIVARSISKQLGIRRGSIK